MEKKIIDGFIFYNELDLLNYRLNILNDVVNYFVIVESTHTFTGREKPLYFDENKKLFESFNHKIIHIIVDDLPYKYPNINFDSHDQWKNEFFQRDCIIRGISKINDLNNDDIIIISDLDEIPDPNTILNIKTGEINVNINSLEMDLYYYNLNTKFQNKWLFAKVLTYYNFNMIKSCCTIRSNNSNGIKNGGWHLSYFGDINFIQNKIQNFSHQEYNNENYNNIINIKNKIENNECLFPCEKSEKIEIDNNHYLPVKYDIYLKKYYK